MQNSIIKYLRTLFSYMIFLLSMMTIGLLLLVTLVLTPRAYIQKNPLIYWLLALLFRIFIGASCIPLRIIKQREIYPYPALYIANHQSAGDVALLGYLQGIHPHVWFYWDHFSHTPIFSLFVTRLGLSITQSDPRHDARSLLRGISLLREHRCNAVIFPEGGRFNDGQVHPFLSGFALLARKAEVPVIPVYIHNMGKAYPPRTFMIETYPVTLYVGEPLTIEPDESDNEFSDRVHAWFDKYTVT